jgi:acetyl esterase/lipase
MRLQFHPCFSFLAIAWLLRATAPAACADGAATRFPLWPEGVPCQHADPTPDRETADNVSAVHTPTLTPFPAPPDKACGAAIIVCPGGGYSLLSWIKEGTEVAQWLNSLGVSVFILRYRAVEYGHPAPVRDVTRAVRMVRAKAGEFGVKSDRIGVLGFSAGGHLASCAATMWDDPITRTGAALDAVSARPDFALLIYPVITMKDPFVNRGSRRSLLGESPSPEMIEALSTETRVNAQTPPVFLINTQEDKAVPVENSLAFYQALRRAGVPAEMHLYQSGPHGFGLRPGHAAAMEWPKAAEVWMRLNGWL